MSAENGEVALTMFERHEKEIKCIVLDLTMPVLDGKETLEAIRQRNSSVPILISSGYSEVQVREIFHSSPMSGVVMKPYQAAALATAVRQALAQTQSAPKPC